MAYATEYIAQILKAARQGKGLSQRALSKLAGMPQSHISKIENGAVDLRLSSLVEIARVLDLAVTLVPRKSATAVQSIIRSGQPAKSTAAVQSAAKEFKRLQQSLSIAMHEHPAIKEIAQLQRQVRELQHFQLPVRELDALREANKVVQAFKINTKNLDGIRTVLADFQNLRNSIVHSMPSIEPVKPAYSLEDDDHV